MKNIFWTAYCYGDRNKNITDIVDICNKYGFVTDSNYFSDISLAIKVEIEENKIEKLYNELKNKIKLNDFELINSSSTKERVVLLNITFSEGTGNLKIEIPSVPG